jgi:CRISPR/Cas system CSM-associated protein Csm3 (group 7 of RAMP superfamily)
MNTYILRFVLESDATFGRGDGLAGVVDVEVQHDEWGCPFLGGRALKGLLVSECAEILAALPDAVKPRWQAAAQRLFGSPGSGQQDNALVSIGDARLPDDLRAAIRQDIEKENGSLKPQEVLESITALRRQTAIDETGVPLEHTLRTVRVILRGTPFEACLNFSASPSQDDLALLAACVKAFRRAGTGRNRGRGRLKAELLDSSGRPITDEHFKVFREGVLL